ncbi:MAG: hypothetical protein RIC19_22640 [Phaeodactylibacter sp.]|uniref:hypothetical protein n=1 Tax=Phaeodactylibacter sp. TaxID=1940289 RepID=UPI0032EAC4AF
MKKTGYLFFLLFTITLLNCNRYAREIDTSYPTRFDLGPFNLLDETISQLPYYNRDEVFFVDENSASVSFSIVKMAEPAADSMEVFVDNIYDDSTGVRSTFSSEYLDDTLRSPALNLELIVRLRARPNLDNPGSRDVGDWVEVWYKLSGDPTFRLAFEQVFNQRSWPADELTPPVDELTIFNRIFENVWVHQVPNSPSEIYFNRQYGIVSFTDGSGKLWRFQNLE